MIVFCMLMKINKKIMPRIVPIIGLKYLFFSFLFENMSSSSELTREQSAKAFDGHQYVYNHER
jgi:hypothetical protein